MNRNYKNILREVDANRDRLLSTLPWSRIEEKRVRDHFRTNLTYANITAHGNPLNLCEVDALLTTGLTFGNHESRYYNEALSFGAAFDFMVDLSQQSPLYLTETAIRIMHELLFARSDIEEIGQYRNAMPIDTGHVSTHPQPHVVNKEMSVFLLRMHSAKERLHPIELAAEIYMEFLRISPFLDGNTKIADLLLNLVLYATGYGFAPIPPKLFPQYHELVIKLLCEKYQYIDQLLFLIAESSMESLQEIRKVLYPL